MFQFLFNWKSMDILSVTCFVSFYFLSSLLSKIFSKVYAVRIPRTTASPKNTHVHFFTKFRILITTIQAIFAAIAHILFKEAKARFTFEMLFWVTFRFYGLSFAQLITLVAGVQAISFIIANKRLWNATLVTALEPLFSSTEFFICEGKDSI